MGVQGPLVNAPPQTSLAAWFPAALIVLASLVAIPALAAAPRDPNHAAGVFPPWWSQSAVLAAAGEAGAVLSVGSVPFIVVVRADHGDVPARLRQAGALFSIDPSQAVACGG